MGLLSYLFGIRTSSDWTEDGYIVTNKEEIKTHSKGKKIIPSNFFGQENTEYISGILFSNQMTVSKFARMAYQKGYNKSGIKIKRSGLSMDMNTFLPRKYEYILGKKDALRETWAQGLSLALNPNAKFPITERYFKKTTTHSWINGKSIDEIFDFHPLNSITVVQVKEK